MVFIHFLKLLIMVGILESLHELLLINANKEILPNEFGIHVSARKRERRSVISKITSIQTESESSRKTVQEGNKDMQTIITGSTQSTAKKDASGLQLSSTQLHAAPEASHFNVSDKMKVSAQQNYTPTKPQKPSQRNSKLFNDTLPASTALDLIQGYERPSTNIAVTKGTHEYEGRDISLIKCKDDKDCKGIEDDSFTCSEFQDGARHCIHDPALACKSDTDCTPKSKCIHIKTMHEFGICIIVASKANISPKKLEDRRKDLNAKVMAYGRDLQNNPPPQLYDVFGQNTLCLDPQKAIGDDITCRKAFPVANGYVTNTLGGTLVYENLIQSDIEVNRPDLPYGCNIFLNPGAQYILQFNTNQAGTASQSAWPVCLNPPISCVDESECEHLGLVCDDKNKTCADPLRKGIFRCRADIGFLIDGSGSIWGAAPHLNWVHLLNLVLVLTQNIGLSQDGAHASLAIFSGTGYDQQNVFTDGQDLASFQNTLQDVEFPGGGTPTRVALQGVLDDMFTLDSGMRTDAPKTLLFITDGQCNDCETLCTIDQPCVNGDITGNDNGEEILGNLRAEFAAIEVTVIGIFIGQNPVNEAQIQFLTDRFVPALNFDELYAPDFPREIGICRVDCKWTDPSPWTECDSVCGDGTRSRKRNVRWPASGGGEECKIAFRTDTEMCTRGPCTTTLSTTTTTTMKYDQCGFYLTILPKKLKTFEGASETLECVIDDDKIDKPISWTKCEWIRTFDNMTCEFKHVKPADSPTWEIQELCTTKRDGIRFVGSPNWYELRSLCKCVPVNVGTLSGTYF